MIKLGSSIVGGADFLDKLVESYSYYTYGFWTCSYRFWNF